MSRKQKSDFIAFRSDPTLKVHIHAVATLRGYSSDSEYLRDLARRDTRAFLLQQLEQAQHEAGDGRTAPRAASVGEISASPRDTPTERAAGVGPRVDSLLKGPGESGGATATPPASLVGVQS